MMVAIKDEFAFVNGIKVNEIGFQEAGKMSQEVKLI